MSSGGGGGGGLGGVGVASTGVQDAIWQVPLFVFSYFILLFVFCVFLCLLHLLVDLVRAS